MILEGLFILAFIFFVAILFYKQALEDFDILQIEGNQLERLPDLLTEQSFVVVRSLPKLSLWNPQVIKQMPALHTVIYGQVPLLTYTQESSKESPIKIISPTFYPKVSSSLSEQTGMKTWVETTWLKKITDSWWKPYIFSSRVELAIGTKGLRKTTAFSTMILPTAGDLKISIMPEKSETFLPSSWRSRKFEDLTKADTPLIGEVKFMDIKVREGSALFMPPHWIVNISDEVPDKPTFFAFIEFHHPLSSFARTLSEG